MKNENKVLLSREAESKAQTDYSSQVNNSSFPFESCLVNQLGKQFACIHHHCQNLPSCFRNGLVQESPDFHELIFHPEDRQLWCEMAFPDIVRFISAETITESPDYRVIFNHRYIRKDGGVSQFMHEGAVLFKDNNQMPVIDLKVFTEIADIKPDETMILTIFRYSAEHGYRKIFSKIYRAEAISCLSERELEVVKLCHEGMSSKMIAEKLNLSIHTVKNHKRNCMAKTNTHNITELIHLCIQHHWL
jgi:DNA-binding CsgD family transcriptional regulator